MVNPATTTERLARLAKRARRGTPIAALTAYDYPTARLLDEAGVDLILVGDSLGMVVLGHKDTTSVTMEMMLHHTAACALGTQSAVLVGDLPFASYETPEMALANARRLIGAGANCVKFEGSLIPQVEAIVGAGIPFVGHIGMLPQHVREEGGYRKKGKTPEQAASLLDDARALENAGAIAIVLESMVASVAQSITEALAIPTIGIGAGGACDGQILVIHDLLGSFPWFRPSFATPRADLATETSRAVREYIANL